MFGFVKMIALIILFCLVSMSIDAENQVENRGYDQNQDSLFENHQQTRDISRGFNSYERSFDGIVSQMNSNDLKNSLVRLKDQERRKQNEFNLGFGGPSHASEKRMLFCNVSTYVNKVINHAQLQLEQNARTIWANNPPQVIDEIPHTLIIFTLKYIQGASSLGTNGTSWAIHYYDEVYISTRFRFDEIRYNYDVQIRPYNLYTIRKSLTVFLGDAPATMSFSMEKNKCNIPRFEYVNPKVAVDLGAHRWFNYPLNYAIHESFPTIKRKLVEIVSRDTLILLNDQLKNAQ